MNKNSINQVARTYQRLVEAASPQMLPEPMEGFDTPEPNLPPQTRDDLRLELLLGEYEKFEQYLNLLRNCQLNPGACSDSEIAQYEEFIRQYRKRLKFYRRKLEFYD
jgi:hypothetical protein